MIQPAAGGRAVCFICILRITVVITIVTIIIVFSIGMRRVPQDFRYRPRNEGTPRKDVR